MNLTDTQRGFVAGILQREGSFMQNLSNGKYHYPRLTLSVSDEWLVDTLIEITGVGKKRHYAPREEGQKDTFIWDISTQADVRALAVEILPLLSEKRKQRILEVL